MKMKSIHVSREVLFHSEVMRTGNTQGLQADLCAVIALGRRLPRVGYAIGTSLKQIHSRHMPSLPPLETSTGFGCAPLDLHQCK